MTLLAAHRPCVVAIPSLPAMPFLLRRLTGLDEAALDPDNPRAATWLLARLLAGPDGHPVDLASLPVAVHDRLLADVYRMEVGPLAACQATCSGCGEPFAFNLGIDEVIAAQDPEADGLGTALIDGSWRVAGRRVRAPRIGDLAGGEASALLSALCDAPPDAAAELEIAAFLERAAPILAFDLDTLCPHCGEAQELEFDLPRFLVRTIANDRPFLIRETHLIAGRYGWSHGEILALPRDDRRAFASLIETERSSALRARPLR